MIRPLLSAWDSFWFKPASPVPMALLRIFIGLAALELLFFQLAPEFFTWFGTNSIVKMETVRAVPHAPVLDLYLLLPGGNLWLAAGFGFVALSAAALTIGLFTRLSAAIVLMGLVSFFHHDPVVLQGPERLLFLALLFLFLSNAGRAFSIDSLLSCLKTDWREKGFAKPLCSPWGQRIVQIELSVLYLQCVYSKLLGELWREGTAVYYTSRIQCFSRIDIPYVFDHIWTIKFLTWATIGVEASLAILLWWRPLRYWVMVLGILFHAGIDITMNIPTFGWVAVFFYISFVDAHDLRKLWIFMCKPLENGSSRPTQLLFDGDRMYSVKIAGLLKRLDIWNCLDLYDLRNTSSTGHQRSHDCGAFALDLPEGRVCGVAALEGLALRLPALWILVPLLAVPGLKGTVSSLLLSCGRRFLCVYCRNETAASVSAFTASRLVNASAWAGICAL